MNRTADHLRRAAESLHNSEEFLGACHAIFTVSCSCDGEAANWPCSTITAASTLTDAIAPPVLPRSGYWFGRPGVNKEVRVLALLFAAEYAESEIAQGVEK